MMHPIADPINYVIRKQSLKLNISTWNACICKLSNTLCYTIDLFVIFAAVSVEVAVVRNWEM
jgi:hypothetical protein